MSIYLDKTYSSLSPYTPGEQFRGKKVIKLNTNESPFPPSPKVQEAVAREAGSLNLYPDITGGALMELMADWLGVKPENIFLGNGSDEILAFCFQALSPNGVAYADLTYGFYPVYAGLYGRDALVLPLGSRFELDVEAYKNLGRTIYIANPNAPTGLALTVQEIRVVLESNRDSLVVIDEAYVDFGAESCVCLLDEFPNLLVVGTFSKSRSLAGGRLGYAAGSKELIADLNLMRFSFNPYNVNQLTLVAGAASVADKDYFKDCRAKIIQTREATAQKLEKLGFACTKSKANFIFAAHAGASAKALYERLKEQGILVRWFSTPRIDNHLRITVGSDGQMDALLDALQAMV